MSQTPTVVVRKWSFTRCGAVRTHALERIAGVLIHRGFILLPSDTGYSLAAIVGDDDANKHINMINMILGRADEPISLAFSSYRPLREGKWVTLSRVGAALIERFTPGPLTVVCRASPGLPSSVLDALSSPRKTIGVRIPDSVAERQIAGATQYPITTVAMRDPSTQEILRSFSHASEIVVRANDRVGNVDWAAVEAREDFYEAHSTVVDASGDDDEVRLLRRGHIPFAEIEAVARQLALRAG